MSNIKKSKSWLNSLKFKLVEIEPTSLFDSYGVTNIVDWAEERGLDPEGVAELDMETSEDIKASPIKQEQSDKNANISGGKNQDKREESARAQNRGNKPSANATGDRK